MGEWKGGDQLKKEEEGGRSIEEGGGRSVLGVREGKSKGARGRD